MVRTHGTCPNREWIRIPNLVLTDQAPPRRGFFVPIENGKAPRWGLDTSDLQRLGTRGANQTGQAGVDASDLQRFGTQAMRA